MTKNEFKIGDRVASEDAKYSGIVTTVDDMGCKVRFADGEELYFLKDILHHSGLPDYDRKTAFLTELQELLRKYDAFLSVDAEGAYCGNDVKKVELSIFFGEECMTRDVTEDCIVDADNIMDFDKE